MHRRRDPRWLLAGSAGAVALGALALAARRRRAQRSTEDEGWPELPDGRPLLVPSSDGATLAVSVAGPSAGRTVVLAHCWMGLRAFWAPVAHRLVDDGYRVVVYDLRGHGHSTLGEGVASIRNLGDDVRAVLEAVDAHEAVLVGHSMGGMSIQSYATEHPEDFRARVGGVVLVATAARVLGRAVPAALAEMALGERALWARSGRLGRRFARRAIGQRAQRAHVDLTLEGVTSAPAVVRSGFLLAMAEMDLRGAAETIAGVPTVVLVGTRDTLTPPRLARQLARAIAGAELDVVPGAGHMLPLEAPDRIVSAVEAVEAARVGPRSPRGRPADGGVALHQHRDEAVDQQVARGQA